MAKRGLQHGGVVRVYDTGTEANGRPERPCSCCVSPAHHKSVCASSSPGIETQVSGLSAYFERHRDEYIERLRAVSDAEAWTAWCRFFLDGVTDQAAENERKVRSIVALFDRVKVDIIEVTRSQHGVRALDYIFRQPVFGSAQFVEGSEIPKPTAQRVIALLRDAGLLHTARPPRGRRGGIYVFTELIEVIEGRSLR